MVQIIGHENVTSFWEFNDEKVFQMLKRLETLRKIIAKWVVNPFLKN